MQTFEITGSGMSVRLSFTAEQDIANNKSVVRIKKVEIKSLKADQIATSCWLMGNITVNGTKAAQMELTNTTYCGFTLQNTDYSGGGEGTWNGFTTSNVTVSHGEDGTADIEIRISLNIYSTSQVHLNGFAQTGQTALPRIPRVSEVSAEAVELGQTMTITISRAAEGFCDTIAWVCGSQSGTIARKTTDASVTWDVPMELAEQVPNDTKVAVVLTVTTWQEDTELGSAQTQVLCGLPESIKPTLSVAVSDRMGYQEQYGGYIQSKSQARVVSQAGGVYGSTITGIVVRCGNLTANGEDTAFELPNSGTVGINVTATDSRGRTAAWNNTISVIAYQTPQVTITEAVRCDQYGTEDPEGIWLKIVFNAAVTAVQGNTAEYRGICTDRGGGESREELLTDYTGELTVSGGSVLFTAGLDTDFECCVQVTDAFTTVRSALALVGVAFALIDFCKATKAVGIGMRAKTAQKVSIGLQVDMAGNGIGNMADPYQAQAAATKSYVDRRAAAQGVDLAEYYAGEIGQTDIWEWMRQRIAAGDLGRICAGDYINLTCKNGTVLQQQIAGINTYRGYGDPEIGNHVDFISRNLWPVSHTVNPVLWNNGFSDAQCPFVASDLYLWLNSIAGTVAADTAAPPDTALASVDYTADGIWVQMPDSLKAVISDKIFYAPKRFSSSGILSRDTGGEIISMGKLWLPTEMEVYGTAIFGSSGYGICGGVQYPIFSNRQAMVKRYGDNEWRSGWWLASAADGKTSSFCSVSSKGVSASINATSSGTRVPVCFRITG